MSAGNEIRRAGYHIKSGDGAQRQLRARSAGWRLPSRRSDLTLRLNLPVLVRYFDALRCKVPY